MDMVRFRESNHSVYVLLGYDTHSKHLASFPMKSRKPDEVEAGLDYFAANVPFPIRAIYWDKVCVT